MKVDYITEEENSDSLNADPKNKKRSPKRILVGDSNSRTIPNQERDVLVVASKLKKYVKEKHGLNTSSSVMERLSDIIRVQCDRAVDNAMKDGRKTLMDRDF